MATVETAVGRFGSGRAVPRIEDRGLLVGAGQFTDDVALPSQAHLAFLRSPHAHARIVSIDAAEARKLPGVVAVVTGADLVEAGVKPIPILNVFRRPDGKPATSPARRGLAHEEVRYVGETVAAVVAETREQAKDALDAIVVEYDPLPAVTTIAQATAEGAPLLDAAIPGNVVAEMRHGKKAEADAAFASAAHVVSLDVVNQRLAATPLEPRSVQASYDAASDRLTIRLSTQMPSGMRDTLAGEVLGIPKEKIRVVVGDVGGGFGMKTGLYPEDIVVAYAARQLKRPVRWTAERIEEFLATTHGRDIQSRAELALDQDGRILAYRIRTSANVGANPLTAGIIIQLMIGPWVSTSIYDIKVIDFTMRAVLTNTAPTGAYRGAGRPEAIYLIERMMDAAARQLGLDPADIRRRNLVKPEQMPYRNAMGQTYDSGKFGQVLEQGLKLADWDGFEKREKESRARGKWRGRGLASFLEWTSGNAFEERATVAVLGSGEIEVYAATMPMGQGIATSYAQLVVDVFGVPIEKIRIVMGDTDRGSGFGSAGSRSLFTAGSTIQVASEKAVALGKELAGDALEAAAADLEYREGEFRVAGTDRAIGLFEVAARQPDHRIFVDVTSKVDGPSWPNGAHIAEVEIDPETGALAIVSYVSANDVGRVVNPMIVRGQLDGGAVQGIGQAVMEHMTYDPESGQALSASLMDYAMPRAEDVPDFEHVLDQSTPCRTNPLGVKGVGELGTIGATPALVNAVADALARNGHAAAADRIQMPLTPARIWAAIRGEA
ncbi:MAG TPA: xanthine dehydrogenase family protein molybdopterin-binding subunit [Stellaceae bacterium]|nr:xanthine dehydrogenase family protein molybdopterin-binding subunit [Stellaceae bacterium]